MLFINGKIMPMDREDIPNGFVRVQDGKIVALGQMDELAPDTGADEFIDLAGRILLPGFIDAHTHMGLQEDSLGEEGDDINEMTDPVTPHLRALDGVNPFDRSFAECREAGITTVVISPGSANPIGGQICAMKTVGSWADAMTVAEPLGIKLAFGENPKGVYAEKNQTPSTRMATAAIIREALYKAGRYMADKEKALKVEDGDAPEYDAKHEALIPLLKREIKAHIHAHRAYDILTGIRLAKEFNLDFILVHCTEGHLIADILGEMKAGAICGPLICARVKPELSNMSLDNCRKLAEAGVDIAVCTDHPVVPGEFLPLSVQVAKANGLDSREALKALTITAARVVALDQRIGSITPGKDADLLVYSNDPLSGFARPEMVYINGQLQAGRNTRHS